ncbi:hypothetical protein NTG1052_210102 [Candidatus Nitrotoga sp. 1052]|nr:hypothetical protein NTG1052_210102 [Candidatus Nitrotoga sp. 1052]
MIKRELAGDEVAVGIMSDCVAVNDNVLVETVDAVGSRVAVSQNERPQNTKDKGTAPHCGQLRHSQTPDVQAWLV